MFSTRLDTWFPAVQGASAPAGVPLFVVTGESNASGNVLNSEATSPELAARPEVQILNTSTLLFETLNIGAGNNYGEAGGRHGIELELANAIAAGRFTQSSIRIVKSARGGSNIQDWNVGAPSGFWADWLTRINAAKSIYASNGWTMVPYVFYSQGLNDFLGYSIFGGAGATTDMAVWKTRTVAHLAKIRAELGASTIIVLTKFRSPYATLNAKIDEIVAADPYCRSIEAVNDDGTLWNVDGVHMAYPGMKNWCQLFIDEVLAANGTSASPTISPAAGQNLSTPQTASISGSGTIKYTTNPRRDPHISTVYSSSFSQSVPAIIRARAIERNKKSSPIVSNAYTSSTAWSTTDASTAGITLANSNLDVAGKAANTWKTLRATQSRSSGLWYFEMECINSGASANNYMIGLASSGASAASFPGNSDYGVGLTGQGTYVSAGFSNGTGARPSEIPTLGMSLKMAVNFTTGKGWVGVVGTGWLGSGDPAADTNQAFNFVPGTVGALYPALGLFDNVSGWWRIKTTAVDQYDSPPSGFSQWG